MPEPGAEEAARRRRKRRATLRLAALALLLVAAFAAGKLTGVTDRYSGAEGIERLRQTIQSAGAAGALLFVVVFCVGELVQVPGIVFIGAAVFAYGQLEGGVLSFLGALASVSFSFWVVRLVGGKFLEEIERPWVRRTLERLDRHPVTTVAVLRTVMLVSPPLNYALALSGMKFRHYLLGSALGLVIPVTVVVVAFDWFYGVFLG